MKKIFKIVLVLGFCFLGKAQAQNVQWNPEEIAKGQQEIALIQEVTPLTDNQKVFLEEVLLNKNRSLANGLRIDHTKGVILQRIEDILRYGMPINRHPREENIHLATERLSEALFKEKILDNAELRKALNLVITDE